MRTVFAGQRDGAGGITGTTYDAGGRVLTISCANGVATTYGYSPQREWLNTVSTVKSTTTIQTATYTRDFAGRITGIDGNRSVYGSKDGYVVVNDRTGEVVAVSDKNDDDWIADSRIKWFEEEDDDTIEDGE